MVGSSPCANYPNKRCPYRSAEPNCHVKGNEKTCEAFQEWLRERDEYWKATAKERGMEREYKDFKIPEVQKSKRFARKMKGKK